MRLTNQEPKSIHISNARILITLFLVVLSTVALTLPNVSAPPRPSAFNVAPSGTDSPWIDSLQDSCYASGLHWVFNDNTTGWRFWTSPNGHAWTASSLSLAAGRPADFDASFHCIGANIYYVYGLGGSTFFYRFGLLNSNSTITWSIPESSVSTSGGSAAGRSIIVDSSNNIWVSVSTTAGMEVYDHTTSWSQSDVISGAGISQLFALTSGKVANVYGPGGFPQQISIKVYSGTWSSAQSTAASYVFAHTAGVSVGDTVYMAASTESWCDLATSTNGGAWSIKSQVLNLGSVSYCTIQKDTGTDLVMFSAAQNTGPVEFAISNNSGSTFPTTGTIVTDVNPTYIATGDFSDGSTFFAYWASGTLGGSSFHLRIGLVSIR